MAFKDSIKAFGKEIDVETVIGGAIYGSAVTMSANPHYDGSLLTAVMKCLDLELCGNLTSVEDRISSFKFGVKAPGGTFEYISFGEYIIKSREYSVGTDSTKFECYDKMLQAMIPYDLTLDYTNGVTVVQLLQAICTRFGWTLGTSTFTNSTVSIEEEKYSKEYTFRDVLTEIAQVAGGVIAFKPDGVLYVIYPTQSNETIDESNLKSLTVGEKYGPLNSLVLARTPQEDNIYRQDTQSIQANGLCEIKIENNQIMDSHRDDFIVALFNRLKGLTYYCYEIASFGIGYLNLCDLFTISTSDNNTYTALFLQDDLKITQGLSETSKVEKPAQTVTEYKAASTTDKAIAQTMLRVNKQEQRITSLVSDVDGRLTSLEQTSENFTLKVKEVMKDDIDTLTEDVDDLKNNIESTFTFDTNGLKIQTGGTFSSTFAGSEWSIKEQDEKVVWVNNKTMHTKNAEVENEIKIGGMIKMVPVNNGTNRGIGFVAIAGGDD